MISVEEAKQLIEKNIIPSKKIMMSLANAVELQFIKRCYLFY